MCIRDRFFTDSFVSRGFRAGVNFFGNHNRLLTSPVSKLTSTADRSETMTQSLRPFLKNVIRMRDNLNWTEPLSSLVQRLNQSFRSISPDRCQIRRTADVAIAIWKRMSVILTASCRFFVGASGSTRTSSPASTGPSPASTTRPSCLTSNTLLRLALLENPPAREM